MVLLFKPHHVQPILMHQKVETRRIWKRRRALPGSLHQARTKMFGPPFAFLRILEVRQEKLGDITLQGVLAEGYQNYDEFALVWREINGKLDVDQIVWVVRFQVETWEKEFPLGCEVILTRHDGTEMETRTRSLPFLNSGSVVVFLDGVTGFYLLERVRAIS